MIAATSGEEGRKALMREIGLGKALADSPLPNVVEFIGCVTTQSKEPFCFCFYGLFLKILLTILSSQISGLARMDNTTVFKD